MKRPFLPTLLFLVVLVRLPVFQGDLTLNRAMVALIAQDMGEAETLLETAVYLDATNGRAWWQLGNFLMNDGQPIEAITAWKQVSSENRWLIEYGRTQAEAARNWEAAQNWFEYAVQVQPDSAEAHYWLGRAFYEQGIWEKAEGELKTAVSLSPTHSPALTYLSRTYIQQGDADGAEIILLQAATDAPDDPEIAATLGNLYRSQGNWPEAAHWLEQAANHPAHTIQMLLDLALVYNTMNKPEVALPYAEQAVQEAPFSTAAQDLLNQTYALLRTNQKSPILLFL